MSIAELRFKVDVGNTEVRLRRLVGHLTELGIDEATFFGNFADCGIDPASLVETKFHDGKLFVRLSAVGEAMEATLFSAARSKRDQRS